MKRSYIYDDVEKLIRKYSTRDPYELLDCLHVIVRESDNYKHLKGFCFLSCRTMYVTINSKLSQPEQRIVAAHELGNLVLHKNILQTALLKDSVLYDMKNPTEYEANLFAADLLIDDSSVEEMAQDSELDYFEMCSSLYVPPDLLSFKLYSMIKRGYPYNMPMDINSTFLAKDKR